MSRNKGGAVSRRFAARLRDDIAFVTGRLVPPLNRCRGLGRLKFKLQHHIKQRPLQLIHQRGRVRARANITPSGTNRKSVRVNRFLLRTSLSRAIFLALIGTLSLTPFTTVLTGRDGLTFYEPNPLSSKPDYRFPALLIDSFGRGRRRNKTP